MQLPMFNSYSATIEELRSKVVACELCPYHLLKRRRVHGEGSIGSPLMIIGQGPGITENTRGKPFLGTSGKLLKTILKKAGITLEDTYMTNLVRCMPPRNKKLISKAIRLCGGWLDDEVGIVNPGMIVCLGGEAAAAITGSTERGVVLESRYGIPAVNVYHTAYLLRVKKVDKEHYKELANEEWCNWKVIREIVASASSAVDQ